MSDERPRDDWLTEDPFANPEDPAARERAERRAEREQKRREKAAKEAGEAPPPAPAPPPAEPPKPKRSPEQEFWDEDPTPEPAPPGGAAAPGGAADAPAEPPAAEPRRRFLRGRSKAEAPPPQDSALAATEPPRPAVAAGEPADPGAEPPTRIHAAVPPPERPASGSEPATPPPGLATEDPVSAPATPPPESATEVSEPEPPTPGPESRPPEPPTEVRPPEPPTEDPIPAPIPVGADPTLPATGEHLVPDPDAPPVRGQTSEEWAVVPAARTNALDDAFHEEGDPKMAGAARSGRRRGDGGGRRGGILGPLARHPFRIVAVILLLVVLYLLAGLFQPFHGDGHGRVAVRIPKGASVSEVGDILEKRGVIEGPLVGLDASTLFQVRVTMAGKRSDLYAGNFTLQKDMSYGAAIDALSREPKAATRPGIAEVLVPPALSRSQVAKLMKEDGIPGNYMKASVSSKLLDPAEYGGKQAKSLEGFLFPDTYEVRTKEGVDGVVRRQLEAFKRNIKKVNMKYANSKNLTVYDVVTIASMIEGEAAVEKERKLVASVIYNRLHEGMPLQIDATVRFATGNHTQPLSESELASDSPYNTYANSGLPAGPINNPGLESLEAAAHPAKTDYLFYVVNPKGCNEHSFSASEEEFLADVEKYEKAREANGGNAPSSCGE